MTIKEIADFITDNKYLFEVTVSGENLSQGIKTISSVLANSESVESYLNKIAEYNKAKYLYIKVRKSAGTTTKIVKEELIFLPRNETVATVINSVATVGKTTVAIPVATEKTTEGNNEIHLKSPITPLKTNPMDTKDYIDFRVLQTEHKNLTQRFEDTKGKVSKLEKKIEELHDENKQLLRDNATKEDKHSLALERAKMEMERESKSGLNGFLEDVKDNPTIVEAFVGFFNKDHPMFDKYKEQKTLAGAEYEKREIKYTEDTQANLVLNDIPRKLSQTNGDTISKIYLLFQEFLAKPDILHKVANTYFPDIFKK